MPGDKAFPISVILISNNNFKYIFEALDSIFKQTYSNIQLIISDDASKDFNLKKLESYIEKHRAQNISDIVINVNAQNMGTVSHLEYVRSKCTGELITVIAADDAYADEFAISRFADEYIANDKQVGVITSLLAMCGDELSDIKSVFTSDKDVELINSGDSIRLFEELAYRCFIPGSGTAMTPEVYRKIGKLSDDYRFIEDWSAHLRIARMGLPIRCIKHVTVLHRGVAQGNTRAVNSVQYDKDTLTIFEKEVEPYASLISKAAMRRADRYYEERKKKFNEDAEEAACRSDKKKIVFYFRKNVVAKGDFALYYRIGEYIAQNTDYDVFCVNNSNAEIQKKYLNSGIHFVDITPHNLRCFDGATFITAYNQLFFMLEEIGTLNNAKILLLFLHPQIYKWMALQTSPSYKDDSVFRLLASHNAYGFMDKANLLAIQRHSSIKLEERYFPVALDKIDEEYSALPAVNKDEINIAWFGRLDGDKVYSFTNFLDNLLGFNFDKPITVHLVGDGNAKDAIDVNKYAPQMRFIFNSYMYGEEKDKYLRENADIVVAMGICALNSATLKIPTVLPIVSTSRFRANKFIFLNDTVDYTLGTNEEDVAQLACKTYTANKIIDMVYSDGAKERIGESCYEYAKDNFLFEKHVKEYLKLIEGTTLTVRDCRKNPSIASQLRLVRLYKLGRKNRTYFDFTQYQQKINYFRQLPNRTKVKKILLYLGRKQKKK
ncbi:MAG: glycosyltransferase [Clostridia bacterium]|nr:glycosyltransferase [Clostridia bacterium]